MREKELRFALICYGGISLAVYMHGITKEIWRLAAASRAFHDGSTQQGSGRVYGELLGAIADQSAVRLRVIADIVAGASAGGINGIFLARAIATGQSLDPLTELWLKDADVDYLLDPDARPLSAATKFWAVPIAGWAMKRRGNVIDRTVGEGAQDGCARSCRASCARAGSNRPSAARPSRTCCSMRSMRWTRGRWGHHWCPRGSRSTCSWRSPILRDTARPCR